MLFLLLSLYLHASSALPSLSSWQTTSANELIFLPINCSSFCSSSYVEWGDGTNDFYSSSSSSPMSHSYAVAGVYNVSIDGEVHTWRAQGKDRSQLIAIRAWGDFFVNSASASVFAGCTRLQLFASDQPKFLEGASLFEFFKGCNQLNSSIFWDLTNVTVLDFMFAEAENFNSRIVFSNSESVVSMDSMFLHAINFNQEIIMDTSGVISMQEVFSNAESFNQSLDGFDTRNVQTMRGMFTGAKSFDRDLSFNTSRVKNMAGMFGFAENFNRELFFDTRQVTTMMSMFLVAKKFNKSLKHFDTSAVVTMDYMFEGSESFVQSLAYLNTSSVYSMNAMFVGSPFAQDVGMWQTSNVSACEAFCARCGLPSFPKCKPCASAIKNTSFGLRVCNCPLGQLSVSETQCVGVACMPPVYRGAAGQCECGEGYIGSVSNTQNSSAGCVPITCVEPVFSGTAGQCVCGKGYVGNVSYSDNTTSGCELPQFVTSSAVYHIPCFLVAFLIFVTC